MIDSGNESLQRLMKKTAAYAALDGDIRRGAVAHAYLIIGADSDVCEALAEDAAHKIADAADILRLPTELKAGAKVLTDDVYRLIADSGLVPHGGRKAYVIRRAETMTDQAQNKLLKTLEEPHPGTVIFLCTAGEEKLLSTVRSRARKIYLSPFPFADLKAYLTDRGFSYADAEFAAAFSGGSSSAALGILSDRRSRALYDLVSDIFCDMKTSADILKYAAALSGYRDMAGAAMGFFLYAARDILLAVYGRTDLILSKQRVNDIIDVSRSYTPRSALAVLRRVAYAEKRLYYNCNFQQAADELLFSLLEVKKAG
jgi:DNA polymerase-3 subunit delta'